MKNLHKNIIIGSGLSSFIVNNSLKKKFLTITTSENYLNHLPIRKKLSNFLKPLSKKFKSRGHYNYILKKSILHDCLIHGGNTNLWGGVCNISNLKKKKFKNIIFFKKISINNTGSFSTNKNYYQMQSKNNNIFNCSNYFKNLIYGHLISFKSLKKNLIELTVKKNKISKYYCENLILAINTVQLIELLINSDVIKDKDIITLNEYKFQTKITLFRKFLHFININNQNVISYTISGIIKHGLGLQKNFNNFFFQLLNKIPIYYHQIFYKKKNLASYVFKKKKNSIEEISNQTDKNFGKSIHYYNLKINKKNINKILKKINKNIYGVSAPFVENVNPGPISNNLINKSIETSKKLNI